MAAVTMMLKMRDPSGLVVYEVKAKKVVKLSTTTRISIKAA